MDDSDSRYEAQRLALNRAVAIAGIIATLTFPLGFYARSAAPAQSSVPILSADGRGYYLVCLLVIAVVAALVQALETDDPARMQNRYGERIYRFRQPAPRTAWMLPAVTLFTACLYLAQYHRLAVVLLMPLACAGLVLAARLARFHIMHRFDQLAPIATAGLQVVTYGVAFFALTAIYAFRARTLIAGPLVFLAGFLLIMQLLDGLTSSALRRMLYAAIGGIALAEIAWSLSYWNVSAWIAGGILASAFFFWGSITRAEHAGGLNARQVGERAALALPTFVILAYLAE